MFFLLALGCDNLLSSKTWWRRVDSLRLARSIGAAIDGELDGDLAETGRAFSLLEG